MLPTSQYSLIKKSHAKWITLKSSLPEANVLQSTQNTMKFEGTKLRVYKVYNTVFNNINITTRVN